MWYIFFTSWNDAYPTEGVQTWLHSSLFYTYNNTIDSGAGSRESDGNTDSPSQETSQPPDELSTRLQMHSGGQGVQADDIPMLQNNNITHTYEEGIFLETDSTLYLADTVFLFLQHAFPDCWGLPS